MISISQAAVRFGLSRSTMLHYDRIGLLSPSYRTSAGYRLYESHDIDRLETICQLRRTGMSLTAIRQLLDESDPVSGSIDSAPLTAILTHRLMQLQYALANIHAQQWATKKLLGQLGVRKDLPSFDKEQWIAFMDAAGMSDHDKDLWHSLFEQQNPDGHQDFLEYLGIDPMDIRQIRTYSKKVLSKETDRSVQKSGPKKT
ncbi:MAG: MerR family transcriptional regulator [Opitutales bacterium]|nr:MerR family transcriptional regulator [Opitutales bacterium]